MKIENLICIVILLQFVAMLFLLYEVIQKDVHSVDQMPKSSTVRTGDGIPFIVYH